MYNLGPGPCFSVVAQPGQHPATSVKNLSQPCRQRFHQTRRRFGQTRAPVNLVPMNNLCLRRNRVRVVVVVQAHVPVFFCESAVLRAKQDEPDHKLNHTDHQAHLRLYSLFLLFFCQLYQTLRQTFKLPVVSLRRSLAMEKNRPSPHAGHGAS